MCKLCKWKLETKKTELAAFFIEQNLRKHRIFFQVQYVVPLTQNSLLGDKKCIFHVLVWMVYDLCYSC